VKEAATQIPLVWAPNMSLGVNLLFAMAKQAAETLDDSYTVTIDETHHIHKKDAPSGTALRLGEKVAEGQGIPFTFGLSINGGAPSPEVSEDGILMRSFREGEVVGEHTVNFANEVELVSFTHHAHSRDALALGAIHATRWLSDKGPGLYDMQDVLGLSDL